MTPRSDCPRRACVKNFHAKDAKSCPIGQDLKMFDPTATPTGTYRAGKKRDKVLAQVLQAAQQEFALKGYNGASMQAIADRAGLPKSNVQYYFKRKANLYVSVLNSIVELWNTSLSDINESDDPAQALERFVR